MSATEVPSDLGSVFAPGQKRADIVAGANHSAGTLGAEHFVSEASERIEWHFEHFEHFGYFGHFGHFEIAASISQLDLEIEELRHVEADGA